MSTYIASPTSIAAPSAQSIIYNIVSGGVSLASNPPPALILGASGDLIITQFIMYGFTGVDASSLIFTLGDNSVLYNNILSAFSPINWNADSVFSYSPSFPSVVSSSNLYLSWNTVWPSVSGFAFSVCGYYI